MAIIMRNGHKADFDPNKMRAAELAVCTDTEELYISYAPGNSKKVIDEVAAAEIEENLKDYFGAPLVAETAADMTDHDKIYVYVGSEAGYTSGDWYYYDGDEWQDGGPYNSTAVATDKTLSVEDKAADGKATGDAINQLKSDFDALGLSVVDGKICVTWEVA